MRFCVYFLSPWYVKMKYRYPRTVYSIVILTISVILYSCCTTQYIPNVTILDHYKKADPVFPISNATILDYYKKSAINCKTGVPCEYPDEVDFRIIVMTFTRASSLKKLLSTIQDLEMDGDRGALEIWIDRDKSTQGVNNATLIAAESFKWKSGTTRVHIQDTNAGIYGQWIHTWRPKTNSKEIGLFLEDDISISKYAWRWLKSAHRKYTHQSNCLGVTLQSEGVNVARGGGKVNFPKNDSVFMFKRTGAWGFAPTAKNWRDFQDWFTIVRANSSFHPYVSGLIQTSWYKSFEKRNMSDSMWSIWHTYFTNKHNQYCVYNNLRIFGKQTALSVHRAEKGLHYSHRGPDRTNLLLRVWDNNYGTFPEHVVRLDWDGKQVSVA